MPMHEHRTIPQRLNDHETAIGDLAERIIAIEQALGIEPPMLIEDVDTKGLT